MINQIMIIRGGTEAQDILTVLVYDKEYDLAIVKRQSEDKRFVVVSGLNVVSGFWDYGISYCNHYADAKRHYYKKINEYLEEDK